MQGRTLAGRYRIMGVVGSGGMAIVYRGEDLQTGTAVAVKVLRPEFLEDAEFVRRFEKEALIVQTYSHKHIVKTFDVGYEDGLHFIVMEYVEGPILKDHIRMRGRLETAEVVDIGRQICGALFYAHSHQLIHRDVKPQNVLMDRQGNAKITDFGIAKAPDMATVTMSSSNVLGSVHYISPEQAKGAFIDEKTDIYSMGVLLYEMATGTVPFQGDTPVAVALKHIQDEPVLPSAIARDIPPALERIILKAMSKDPALRYDNAREMARDLERVLQEPGGAYVTLKTPPLPTDTMHTTRTMPLSRPAPQKVAHAASAAPPPEPQAQQGTSGQMRRVTRDTARTERPDAPRGELSKRLMQLSLGVSLVLVLLALGYLGIRSIINLGVPSSVQVPPLSGISMQLALQRLEDAGLQPEIQEAYNKDVTAGTVISQNPSQGTTMPRGDIVQLTVSLGPQPVEVPKLSGMTFTQAQDAIARAGLELGDVRYEQANENINQVVNQTPPAGEHIAMGEKVHIWIAKAAAQQEIIMPNVVDLHRDAALQKLVDMHIEVDRIRQRNSNAEKNKVIKQEPDVGTPITADTSVVLYISNGITGRYAREQVITLTVPGDGKRVKILMEDGGDQIVVFEDDLPAGEQELSLLLESETVGDKTLVIHFGGTETQRISVTFTEEDAT